MRLISVNCADTREAAADWERFSSLMALMFRATAAVPLDISFIVRACSAEARAA